PDLTAHRLRPALDVHDAQPAMIERHGTAAGEVLPPRVRPAMREGRGEPRRDRRDVPFGIRGDDSGNAAHGQPGQPASAAVASATFRPALAVPYASRSHAAAVSAFETWSGSVDMASGGTSRLAPAASVSSHSVSVRMVTHGVPSQ